MCGFWLTLTQLSTHQRLQFSLFFLLINFVMVSVLSHCQIVTDMRSPWQVFLALSGHISPHFWRFCQRELPTVHSIVTLNTGLPWDYQGSWEMFFFLFCFVFLKPSNNQDAFYYLNTTFFINGNFRIKPDI